MSSLHRTVLALLTSCCAFAACDSERSSTPPQPSPAVEQNQRVQPTSEAETRAALRSLYGARHTADLPTRETIQAHVGGEDAVRWLATHDDTMMVRARALASLRMFPNADSEEVVRSVLTAPTSHRALRSAALRALQGWDLSQRDDLRALVITGLQSDEVPVAIAAAHALAGVPEATTALQHRLSEQPQPAVQRAIEESL